MDALKLLKEQHREVEDLFEQIEKAKESDEKQALFEELADNLAAHATIEEKLFYPAAYGKETKEVLTEAVEEHLAMKRIIADLLTMTPDDDNFDAKVKVLKEQVEHHVQEEESELFSKARDELGKEKLETLGEQMEAMFEEELAEDPSTKVPEQTDQAAPL